MSRPWPPASVVLLKPINTAINCAFKVVAGLPLPPQLSPQIPDVLTDAADIAPMISQHFHDGREVVAEVGLVPVGHLIVDGVNRRLSAVDRRLNIPDLPLRAAAHEQRRTSGQQRRQDQEQQQSHDTYPIRWQRLVHTNSGRATTLGRNDAVPLWTFSDATAARIGNSPA